MLRPQIQTAVSLVYPPRCSCCDEMVEQNAGLCGACWKEMHFISGTVCEGCGCALPGEQDGFRAECDSCLVQTHPWSQGRAALEYHGRVKDFVMGLKYGDRTDVAKMAAGWMLRASKPLLRDNPIVTPVPLHWTRFLRRRYNQSALLAEAFSDQAGLEYGPNLLRRTRWTPSLDRKTREVRYQTLNKVIQPHARHCDRMQGRVVLVVDDVMTSGATLAACADACLAAGASDVRVCVLARVTQQ